MANRERENSGLVERVQGIGVKEMRDDVFELLSKKTVFGTLTILPATAVFTFVLLIPILWALAAGFFQISVYAPEWQWAGLSNYEYILTSKNFYDSIWKATVFTVGSISLQIVWGVALALLINRSIKLKSIVRGIALLPYLISTAVVSFVALWMANSQFGIINQLLVQSGFLDNFLPWYGKPGLAMTSVILTSSWKYSVFVAIMVLARLQSIPDDLYEAAQVSGATAFQRFVDITLPNLKNVLFIVILLRGVWTFNTFDIIYLLTQGGPIGQTRTVSIYAYNTAFTSGNLGQAAAVSTIIFAFLIVVAIIYFRVFEPSKEVRVE